MLDNVRMERLQKARFYREQAAYCREQAAAAVTSAAVRDQWLALAEQYDKLAQQAVSLGSGRRAKVRRMRASYISQAEFFTGLRQLLDAWCDRRCFGLLAAVLPAYTAFDGMADGWGDLLAALRHALALRQHELLPAERNALADLKRAAESAFHNAVTCRTQ